MGNSLKKRIWKHFFALHVMFLIQARLDSQHSHRLNYFTMDDKEKTALYTKKQKNVIGKWMEQEMSEVAKLLRNEFMESGQVTDTTRQRLKEILEDKNKREIFAEVISQEEEDEAFDEFMIDLVSAKN